MDTKATFKKTWDFLWHSDSTWSWLANLAIAFLLIKFIIYPGLGLLLGTNYPIVAVLSESMEHGLHNQRLCGEKLDDFKDSFPNYWENCGDWYENNNLQQQQFQKFPFKQGLNKGDIVIVWRAKPEKIQIGDVLIFQGNKPQPIIHRLVKKWEAQGQFYFQTKGDHNDKSSSSIPETKISENRLLGKGILRIPYLGWIKIAFVEAVKPLGWTITK